MFHNPQAKTQKLQQEFKMEEDGEEEIQEVPRERKGRVHTLFPPIIPIFASTPATMMPKQAPGPWPGSDPNQVQGPHLRAGQGHLVPPKKKKKPEKQTQPIIPNLPRGLPGIAISKVVPPPPPPAPPARTKVMDPQVLARINKNSALSVSLSRPQ